MSVVTTTETRVALVEPVTDLPLPMPTFESVEHAEDFLRWCDVREGFDSRLEIETLPERVLANTRNNWAKARLDDEGNLLDG